MSDRQDLASIRCLYGGYWKYELRDFCYMVNQYFPPQDMMAKMAERVSVLSKSYPSTNAHVSSLLADHMNLSAENVVIANGACELISVIGQQFVDRMAIPIPTFDEYINRLRIQGKEVCPYLMRKEEDFALDLDSYIEFAEGCNANTVLFQRPNNPTGNLIPKSAIERALDRLSAFDVVLIDESFIEFSGDREDASTQDLLDTLDNLIIVKSLSKVYGIPGLRIGCAVSANTGRMGMLRKLLPIWNINSFAQCFVESLSDYGEEFRESCVQTSKDTRGLHSELSMLQYLRPYETDANFVLCELTDGLQSSELAKSLFDEHRMLIHDCSVKAGLDSRFVRIASRTKAENGELIAALTNWRGWRV